MPVLHEQPHELFTTQMQRLGRRIGEMHAMLAGATEVTFAPEPIGPQDLSRWHSALQLDMDATLRILQQRLPALSEPVRTRAEALISTRERVSALIRELTAAPIEVGPLLRESLFEKVDTAILTSATLATGRGFEFLRSRLGLGSQGLETSDVELEVDERITLSPFDFQSQTVLAVPTDLPPAEGAFYCFAKVDSELDPMEVAERLIREHKVAVLPGMTFGIEGCYLRIAYGALKKETVAEGMGRLVRGLSFI